MRYPLRTSVLGYNRARAAFHVIGEGGMGVVAKATDLRLQRTVAVKVMHSKYAHHKDVLERFAREAMVIAKLRSRHVSLCSTSRRIRRIRIWCSSTSRASRSNAASTATALCRSVRR